MEKHSRTHHPTSVHLRSLTRFVIGAGESVFYDLLNRIQVWETQIVPDAPLADSSEPTETEISDTISLPEPEGEISDQTSESESDIDRMRLATIGLIFDAQDQFEQGTHTLRRAVNLAGRLAGDLARPLTESKILSPAFNQFEKLVKRGEQQVGYWIELGRAEEKHGRVLAQRAMDETVDGSIKYLTGNQEIRELVETQSASLATEVVEEVRERTVSADTLLEGIARAVLRRLPRSVLPEPPIEVRRRAAPIHPKVSRSKKQGL